MSKASGQFKMATKLNCQGEMIDIPRGLDEFIRVPDQADTHKLSCGQEQMKAMLDLAVELTRTEPEFRLNIVENYCNEFSGYDKFMMYLACGVIKFQILRDTLAKKIAAIISDSNGDVDEIKQIFSEEAVSDFKLLKGDMSVSQGLDLSELMKEFDI